MAVLRVKVDGERLVALRKIRDLSQEALAEKAGSSQTTIHRMENKREPHDMDIVVAVATVLEVPLGELGVSSADQKAIHRRVSLIGKLREKVLRASHNDLGTVKSASNNPEYPELSWHTGYHNHLAYAAAKSI